jgi:hypothetical protein
MSPFFHSVRQKQQDRPVNQEAQEGSVSGAQSAEVKELPGSSRKKRSVPLVTSPLFHSDPEENVRLWMQKYFTNVSVSREEAIRLWLARPPEFRVQILENPTSTEKPSSSDRSGPSPQEATNGDHSDEIARENPKRRSERTPQLMASGTEDLLSNRSRKLSKLLFRIATYAILGFLIIKLLWAIPMTHIIPHADSSILATKSRALESGTAPNVPALQSHENIATRSDMAVQPSRIESLSIGCKDAQPCIEINTLGKEIVPRLSALTDPDRLVIVFQDAVYSSNIHRIPVGRGVVKAVRIWGAAGIQPASTRVVIDLSSKSDYELHTLTNRFVLNLSPKATTRQPE